MAVTTKSLCVAVVEAVADAERVDPLDLTPPLADAVDPDALDAVLRSGTSRVSFEYHGYEITVGGADAVELRPLNRS